MGLPTAVIQVEGVLVKPVGGAVTDTGRRLYHGLKNFYRLVLVTEETDRGRMDADLFMEGFTGHDHVVYGDEPVSCTRGRWVTVAGRLRNGYGYDTELFVVPDPYDARCLIQAGYSTLLFTQAAYALPEWRPDHQQGVRPWDELQAEVETQRVLRAADKRTDEELR